MSKIVFLTSQKEINLSGYNITSILSNDYISLVYPCLKNKNFLYNFNGFENKTLYKKLVKDLFIQAKDNEISLVVLEETCDIDEINYFNKQLQNVFIINKKDEDKMYDLIYKLENNSLISSSEYVFKNL